MKLRIVPDSLQADALKKTMKDYSKACDHVSDHIFKTHELNISSLTKALYYDIRNSFSQRCRWLSLSYGPLSPAIKLL